ncbi:transcription termination factor MTEF1, chloroplastic [Elaeis guineensis]|uniref:Transcription termination factor MTEF1, chloroplastic n=1 Tax=Elaeis guineensis var. tenera TaxID=51953 RepID=A0A6I9S3W1_ELAGV|nr:transcription termination factor MTEF1, chloroplastic [Elaeis guineensis]XP_019709962.1 transcription termination factor MTEF1, chloroplastic [Elaeis guineensis]
MALRLQPSLIPPPSAKPPKNPNPKPRTACTPLRPLSPTVLSSSTLAVAGGDAGLRFREKLLYLEHDLGVDSSKALSLNPALRAAPLSSLCSIADFLASFGLRPADSGRIFSMYPHLLTCDPSADLRPVFDFLLGPTDIPSADIRKAVVRCPRLLVSSVPGQLQPALYFLRRLGFVGQHRISCQTTVLLVSSVEGTLIPKLDYLQSLGFSSWETKKMVLRSPGLLTFSIENNFRPKVAFLVREMGREISELKEFPQYFSFSLEGKIKPRHQMLVENGFSMPLSEMLKVSDGEFRQRLVEMRLNPVGEKL